MNVHHTLKTIFSREPASAGSLDTKERSVMRMQCVSRWFLGVCVMLYVSMIAAPATASVPTIKKICPPKAVTAGPDTIVGTVWGYVETFAPYIAVAAALVLVLVAGTKLRDKVTKVFLAPVIGLLIISTVVTIVTNLPGTTC